MRLRGNNASERYAVLLAAYHPNHKCELVGLTAVRSGLSRFPHPE
jgi:hypothetical protein